MKSICLSCYLTERKDPQRGKFWEPNNSAVVKGWIESVERLGLTGLIFHDNLSDQFIEDWASANVQFKKIAWKTPWTAAEERVRIYFDWLRENPEYVKIMTTDLSDVEFYRDPFPLMSDPDELYLMIEGWSIGRSCLKTWMRSNYGEVLYSDELICNPGVLGGARNMMLSFLERWLNEMSLRPLKSPSPPGQLPDWSPCDIVCYNVLIRRERIPFTSGPPLHTRFWAEEPFSCGAAVRHK